MKKIVMIIAERNFRDEEFLEPKAAFERAGLGVTVASTNTKEAIGTLGAKVKPDILLAQAKAADFDAAVFIGGAGSEQYWDDPTAHKLARDAFNTGKVLAAICAAPVTLARAGLLKGKKATCWYTEAESLKAEGADYTGAEVQVEGRLITANGPKAAAAFAKEIIKALNK